MGNYVAYLRQSTAKQERSGLGIEAQRDIISSFVKEGLALSQMAKELNGQGFVSSKGCKFQIVQVQRLIQRYIA